MANRHKLIQLVHIGTKNLFNDEELRRDWQQQHGGHRSCKDMTDAQLENCVKVLKQANALQTRPPKRAGRVPFNRSPYMSKIEALLTDMQLSWQYAESISWRQTGGKGEMPHNRPGVKRLEWVHKREHFEALIAALEKEQSKRRYLAKVEGHMQSLNLTEENIETLLKENDLYTQNWKRNLGILKSLSEHLEELTEY